MLGAPEPLTPGHDLDAFSCDEPSLDDWLRRRAKANQETGASRTFVVCEAGVVVAYYALASSAISLASSPGRFRRNMPDPIPVVVLARLGVASALHGRGVGRALFQDAARRLVAAADVIGIRGLIVHALSDDAARFYRHIGLTPSPLEPTILMVTVAELRNSLPI